MRRSQQGLTLPEVLVAAVLLGLAILCISPMMSYSFKSSHLNKERSGAVQAAQRIVEQIRSAGFVDAASKVNSGAPSAILPNDLYNQPLYIKGTGEVQSTPGSNTKPLSVVRVYHFLPGQSPAPADDQIQVTVKITWPGSANAHVSMGTTLVRSSEE